MDEIIQGEIGWEITLNSLQNKESIMINSPGGSLFEGLAMYDYVKAHNIEVGVIGLCASAATLPLIASSKRWGTPNSRYLIHNPSFFIPPSNMTAEQLQKDADTLKAEQERALDLYMQVLSGTREEIQALMDLDTVIDAKKALEIGLITEIRDIKMINDTPEQTRDLNKLYNKFKMSMENKEIKEELTGLRSVLEMISKSVRQILHHPKMLVLQDVNGVELDFGSSIETPEQIIVGVTASVAGAPANGKFVMPDGKSLNFENGTLTEIEVEAPIVDEKLKQENEDLKVEVALLKEENEAKIEMVKQIELKLQDLTNRFDEIQSKLPVEAQKINTPPIIEMKNEKKGFTWNFKN